MEENYKLEKEYRIPFDIFREGYRAFQKKFVYPKSYILVAVFLILAADFIYSAVKEPNNYLTYILAMICLSLGFREWYNPRKIRRQIIDAVHELGEPVYKILVAETYADISTVVSLQKTEEDDSGDDEETLPEPTRIPFDNNFSIEEYDSLFLIIYGKSVFYIVPKNDFSESELNILRDMKRK